MICQLQCLEEAVTEISRIERIRKVLLRNTVRSLSQVMQTIGLGNRSNGARNVGGSPDGEERRQASGRRSEEAMGPRQKLKAGDRVRVKSLEEIMNSLDGENKFQGLAFTPVMDKYCGGTYTVLKKVDRIFDERKWKLSKIKNVVLLDGVFCDGCGGIEKEWDGCDRTCYIWWKEGWLERVGG